MIPEEKFNYIFGELTSAFDRYFSAEEKSHWFRQMNNQHESIASEAIHELAKGDRFPNFKEYHSTYSRIKRELEGKEAPYHPENILPRKLNHWLFQRLQRLLDHSGTNWDIETKKMKILEKNWQKGMTSQQGKNIVIVADKEYGIPGNYPPPF